MSEEKKKATELDENIMDHDYDGIKELDNPPPRWIMLLFYITIGWSIIYGAYYFWLKEGLHQDAEYAAKSMTHDQKYQIESLDADALVAFTDEASLAEGKQIYTDMACMACHGMAGEGNAIGPNITDGFWIHGCDIQSVFNIIKNGEPTKGMTAFKGQISDDKIQKVASYVMSLKGTNPPNAKAAQGEKCED
ncbi:c-type cytochrome [Prolixibacteraceae bacterium Z1-6]|uniref:C-type cytochrome n=1 Tax=Draconibacterium aestuarii TaxID=2998507 RepID=A0A9X3F4H1_9BACT|nr:c-type cytochrome [Prolixibacteraceae bacterium Z1-6]